VRLGGGDGGSGRVRDGQASTQGLEVRVDPEAGYGGCQAREGPGQTLHFLIVTLVVYGDWSQRIR
jgi:hypothetical protein